MLTIQINTTNTKELHFKLSQKGAKIYKKNQDKCKNNIFCFKNQ